MYMRRVIGAHDYVQMVRILDLAATPTAAPLPLPAPVCAATLRSVRGALGAWMPAVNHLWPRSFREVGVRTVLMLARRLECAAQERGVRRASARLRRLYGAPPPLPKDVWLYVLGFCARDWWRPALSGDR